MNLGVAQLVARYLGVVEAASSSLVTQTRNRRMINLPIFLYFTRVFRTFRGADFCFLSTQKREKNRKKSSWYKIWYKGSKSVFQKRVEAVSKFKILKGKNYGKHHAQR